MGIKHLNQYLKSIISQDAMKIISLKPLTGKIIAIDTSIFMYKFYLLEGGSIVDHFRKMVELFRSKQITPFYVFDGKPPPEKKEVLEERSREKKKAEKEYKELEKQLEVMGEGISKKETEDIKKQMDHLKANFIRIKKSDYDDVKRLFDELDVQYFESPGESDLVLAYLVESNKAYAVLSDDMDFFLYGLKRVLRQFNLKRKSCVLYNTDLILKELKVTMKEFQEVTILAGSDYNEDKDLDLNETWDLMFQYKKIHGPKPSFYEWLEENKLVTNINIKKLNEIIESFNIKTNPYFIKHEKLITSINIVNEWTKVRGGDDKWERGEKLKGGDDKWERGKPVP